MILIFASIMGGCAGSTAGGMKVIRFVIIGKQGVAHVRASHSSDARYLPIKVDGTCRPGARERSVSAGFFAIYVVIYAATMLLLMMDGMDQVTAFGAVAACINNLGPGLGNVAVNFAAATPESKVLLSLTMLLGRLEIFTFIVLLTPEFWTN